jgi:hypothetical protein
VLEKFQETRSIEEQQIISDMDNVVYFAILSSLEVFKVVYGHGLSFELVMSCYSFYGWLLIVYQLCFRLIITYQYV